MGHRKWDEPHRDALVRFVEKLQERMESNMRWPKHDEKIARHGHLVIGGVFQSLLDAAKEAGVPQQDLGLTDWQFPKFEALAAQHQGN